MKIIRIMRMIIIIIATIPLFFFLGCKQESKTTETTIRRVIIESNTHNFTISNLSQKKIDILSYAKQAEVIFEVVRLYLRQDILPGYVKITILDRDDFERVYKSRSNGAVAFFKKSEARVSAFYSYPKYAETFDIFIDEKLGDISSLAHELCHAFIRLNNLEEYLSSASLEESACYAIEYKVKEMMRNEPAKPVDSQVKKRDPR